MGVPLRPRSFPFLFPIGGVGGGEGEGGGGRGEWWRRRQVTQVVASGGGGGSGGGRWQGHDTRRNSLLVSSCRTCK